MADIEKARELRHLLEKARFIDAAHGRGSAAHLYAEAAEALRNINAEAEWSVRLGTTDRGDDCWRVVDGLDEYIAECPDKATARRIARLPALERASRQMIDDMNKSRGLDIDLLFARDALRAALDQEDQ